MKQVVMNLSNRQYGEKKTKSRDLARPKSPPTHKTFGSFEPHDEPEIVKPGFITVVSIISFIQQGSFKKQFCWYMVKFIGRIHTIN